MLVCKVIPDVTVVRLSFVEEQSDPSIEHVMEAVFVTVAGHLQ